MNADLYVEILEKYLVPFLQQKYPNGHNFMQDNDPKLISTSPIFFPITTSTGGRHHQKTQMLTENLWHELRKGDY